MEIRFISGNEFKIEEAKEILQSSGITVVPVNLKIEELQTRDTSKLVRNKVLKAFNEIGRPLFVEHTGLYLNYLNGFPGGLTQIFWDTLQADIFTELFMENKNSTATAKTVIGYCDGKQIHLFEGEVNGNISSEPRGNRDFQWDCVFIPEGYNQTFSELGKRKNEISMRRKALDEFKNYLNK
jgi:XTP/dITP diphosphohydrolase